MQLLTVVIPKLEELAKEGEQGQKQITKYTRWLTVGLSLVQSAGYIVLFRQYDALPDLNWWRAALIVLQPRGRRRHRHVARRAHHRARHRQRHVDHHLHQHRLADPVGRRTALHHDLLPIVLFMVIALAVVVGVIWITTGERRVPVQYAKRVVGRRMMGGQSTFIPLKVNMAGVIPVIFASSVMMIIPTFAQFLGTSGVGGWFNAHVRAEHVPLHHRRGHPHRHLHLLLHGGDVQPHRPGRQPQEVRRVHPRRASRPADRGVSRPHPDPADVPGRAVPGRPGRCCRGCCRGRRSTSRSTSAAPRCSSWWASRSTRCGRWKRSSSCATTKASSSRRWRMTAAQRDPSRRPWCGQRHAGRTHRGGLRAAAHLDR